MKDDFPPLDDDIDYSSAPAHGHHGYKKGAGKGKSKLWLLIAGSAVLLLAGGGVYWFLAHGQGGASKTTPSTKQPAVTKAVGNRPQANATTKTYKSDKLNIEFNYRSDWTLKESKDKEAIILTSPLVTYSTKDGVSKEGVFTLKMRNGLIPDAIQTAVQNAVAVKDSEVIAYAKPTDAQRQYTNLSFGGPDAKSFGFVIVSGSIDYKAGQNFGSQINLVGTSYLFAGGYGQDETDSLAFESVPSGAFDSEAYQQAVDIIESLRIY